MRATLRFIDHEGFQRAALHMAVAGVLAGLAVHVGSLIVPGFGPITAAWAAAGLLAATALGAAPPAMRARVAEIGLVAGVAGAAGAIAALVPEGGLAALALAFGLLVARGGRRFAATFITAGAAFLVCREVFVNLVTAAGAHAVPMWITAGATGGAFAFVGVLGLLPRHLDLNRDRVRDAHDAVKDRLVGELRELADRGLALWAKIEPSLAPEAPERRAFEGSLCRLYEVAGRWAEVEADGARTPADVLAARMASITEKMERTDDAIAKAQYQQAHAALSEQARYLKEMSVARERIIARMHNYFAAVERLRFALINYRSADASRLSTEVQPILDDLNDLGREIDFSSDALGEVEKDQPPKK
jgi:hypothetical protein